MPTQSTLSASPRLVLIASAIVENILVGFWDNVQVYQTTDNGFPSIVTDYVNEDNDRFTYRFSCVFNENDGVVDVSMSKLDNETGREIATNYKQTRNLSDFSN